MKLKRDKGIVTEEEILEMARSLAAAEPAYMVGSALIRSVCDETGMEEARAAEMLLDGGGMPRGIAAISARAANDLMRIAAEEGLEQDAESYLGDEKFMGMLLEMPVKAALRLYGAECRMEQKAKEERERGARDIMEKLAARQALPTPIKGSTPVMADTDYASMSSEQFRRVKENLMRAAAGGQHVRL